MDMSICAYGFESMTKEFASTYNPMNMISDGELSTIKADRMPIEIHEHEKNSYTNIKFNMHKDDEYIDQYGSPKSKIL